MNMNGTHSPHDENDGNVSFTLSEWHACLGQLRTGLFSQQRADCDAEYSADSADPLAMNPDNVVFTIEEWLDCIKQILQGLG